jgi:glycosyltransferase involved in cell wall biosynthesis
MRGARSRAVVVTWDLAHNGASAAYVLADLLRRRYDVEIVGPTCLGTDLWEPIRQGGIPIRSFPGRKLPEFVDDAERFVDSIDADVVFASKPRFPSLLLAALIKDQCGAPVVFHVDDLELGLAGAAEAISLDELERRRDAADFAAPGGPIWASACEPLVADADAITVSGEELSSRYGGAVLGQPRDETRFDPALFDRHEVRARFGYSEHDRVVLFLGSPRPHKGILELAAAVAEIDDHRVKLCVIGSFSDDRLRERVARLDRRRIRLVGYRPISEVPRLLMIGDLVCLPQDPTVEFTSYQTPMKLTEALAMGIPVLARETRPLTGFARGGLIETVGDAPLSRRISELFADPEQLGDMARRGRGFFLERLCYAAALGTIDRVIAELPRDHDDVPQSWERACELACHAGSVL